MTSTSRMSDAGKLVLRLAVGIPMLFNGVAKLGDLHEIHEIVHAHHLPDALTYGVLLGEVVGPVLIVLGLFTRIGGVVVAGDMVFAIALKHAAAVFKLSKWGALAIEVELLYCLSAIAIALLGPGAWAIGRGRTRRWWLE
jgi:putative oxidoreductase